MITVTLKNRAAFDVEDLKGYAQSEEVIAEIKAAYRHNNPKYFQLARMNVGRTGERPVIKTWQLGADGVFSVPRGGRSRMIDVFDNHGLRYRVNDQRFDSEKLATPLVHRVELWDLQRDLLQSGIDSWEGIWRSPPGSGKTTAALAYICAVGVPSLVIVPNKDLLKQWIARCQKEVGIDPGVIWQSTKRVGAITITTQQTIIKCMERFEHSFGCVVVDEAQRCGAATFNETVNFFPARRRLGITADERRSDGKHPLIYDQFGSVICQVTKKDIQDRGYIRDVEVRVILSDFRAPWYFTVDEDERPRHADRLYSEMVADPDREALISGLVDECVDDRGHVVALSLRRLHCEQIADRAKRGGFSVGLLMGDSGDEFEQTKQGMLEGKIQVVAGTFQAMGVGFDVPKLERGIFALPVANSQNGKQQWEQFSGRFARAVKGKATPVVYYVLDHHVYGVKPLRHLVRWNKSVRVRVDGRWVDGRDYMHTYEKQQDEKFGGLFV